ncbi:hypothetical protein M6B38_410750 [Iris pallida]|uniref:Uncharacterized protein n=1 Tax=Iris pallida TaxID=29817 RepID=A0AAX6FMN9_IRIPA|nr:hypothetical protein M6B38_410750 [Iris pallida]
MTRLQKSADEIAVPYIAHISQYTQSTPVTWMGGTLSHLPWSVESLQKWSRRESLRRTAEASKSRTPSS